MANLELVGQDFSLTFSILSAPDKWFQLLVQKNDRAENMGENAWDEVFPRLLSVLNLTNFPIAPAKLQDGNNYTCFAMLYQQENSAYARLVEDGIVIQFLNRYGQPTTQLKVNRQECEIWTQQIRQFAWREGGIEVMLQNARRNLAQAVAKRRRKIANAVPQLQKTLDLSRSGLDEIPRDLVRFSQLQKLDLSHNYLTVIPPEFFSLRRLQWLDLSGNQLTVLPPEICQLSRLQWLNLSNNQIAALPPELSELSELKKLYLRGNQIASLPDSFPSRMERER